LKDNRRQSLYQFDISSAVSYIF